MAKKLAGMGADMIGSRPTQLSDAADLPSGLVNAKPATQYGVNLNFRVPAEFRRRFRGYAASHDLKLNEVLIKAFDALLNTSA